MADAGFYTWLADALGKVLDLSSINGILTHFGNGGGLITFADGTEIGIVPDSAYLPTGVTSALTFQQGLLIIRFFVIA